MNNRGQSLFAIMLTALVVLIFGFMMLNFIAPEVTRAMDNVHCGSNTSPNMTMTDGQKGFCLLGEAVNPYYILAILGVVGSLIGERVISGGSSG